MEKGHLCSGLLIIWWQVMGVPDCNKDGLHAVNDGKSKRTLMQKVGPNRFGQTTERFGASGSCTLDKAPGGWGGEIRWMFPPNVSFPQTNVSFQGPVLTVNWTRSQSPTVITRQNTYDDSHYQLRQTAPTSPS